MVRKELLLQNAKHLLLIQYIYMADLHKLLYLKTNKQTTLSECLRVSLKTIVLTTVEFKQLLPMLPCS